MGRAEVPSAPTSVRVVSTARRSLPAPPPPTSTAREELLRFYAEEQRAVVVPVARRGAGLPAADDAPNARDADQILRAVYPHQPAFRACIERELRSHPSFPGGKIHLVASLASSGEVTQARIDRPEVDASDLGRCLKESARRITFPAATTDTDVEIPLILARS